MTNITPFVKDSASRIRTEREAREQRASAADNEASMYELKAHLLPDGDPSFQPCLDLAAHHRARADMLRGGI